MNKESEVVLRKRSRSSFDPQAFSHQNLKVPSTRDTSQTWACKASEMSQNSMSGTVHTTRLRDRKGASYVCDPVALQKGSLNAPLLPQLPRAPKLGARVRIISYGRATRPSPFSAAAGEMEA